MIKIYVDDISITKKFLLLGKYKNMQIYLIAYHPDLSISENILLNCCCCKLIER